MPNFSGGIVGTREIQPPDAKVPRLGGHVQITIGRPITPDRYLQRTDDHLVLREMTDEVMFEIQSMTGQQYRNVYASQRQVQASTESSTGGREAVSSGK